jgi:hypothetical protein
MEIGAALCQAFGQRQRVAGLHEDVEAPTLHFALFVLVPFVEKSQLIHVASVLSFVDDSFREQFATSGTSGELFALFPLGRPHRAVDELEFRPEALVDLVLERGDAVFRGGQGRVEALLHVPETLARHLALGLRGAGDVT